MMENQTIDKLIEYSNKYYNIYKQPEQSLFHTIISCVCSQQVSFVIGRNIRNQLYELCGFPLTIENIKKIDLYEIKNLSQERIDLINQLIHINYEEECSIILNKCIKLKGFGEWTFGAVSILMGLSDNINLYRDSYIRKNLMIYTNDKNMKIKDCKQYISLFENDQTKICYFL